MFSGLSLKRKALMLLLAIGLANVIVRRAIRAMPVVAMAARAVFNQERFAIPPICSDALH
jgi:hypothetical protein